MDTDYKNRAAGENHGADKVSDDGLVWLSLTFMKNIRLLLIATLVGAVLFALISFLVTEVYRAEVKLIPSTRLSSNQGLQLPSGLRGASALMGVNLGGQDQDLSQLFGQFVKTEPFAERILKTRFADGTRIPFRWPRSWIRTFPVRKSSCPGWSSGSVRKW